AQGAGARRALLHRPWPASQARRAHARDRSPRQLTAFALGSAARNAPGRVRNALHLLQSHARVAPAGERRDPLPPGGVITTYRGAKRMHAQSRFSCTLLLCLALFVGGAAVASERQNARITTSAQVLDELMQ